MKRVNFLMIALLLMGGIVMAQGRRKGEQVDPKVRAERMTERMTKEYSLNDKQKKELLEVNMTLVEKMGDRQTEMKQSRKASVGEEKSGKRGCRKDCKKAGRKADKKDEKNALKMTQEEREKRKQELKTSREVYDGQLKKILTKEQYESYIKKQTERQQKMEEGHQDRKRKQM